MKNGWVPPSPLQGEGKKGVPIPPPLPFDVIVLGAGAAGMMAAATAGARGRRVLLLDHADAPGKKILISGGGRCNFTNTGAAPDRFLSENKHFARSALGRYTPADFIALVEKHGIAYHEKTLGQLFCDGSARQIVALLVDECDAAGGRRALRPPHHRGRPRRVRLPRRHRSWCVPGAEPDPRHRRPGDPQARRDRLRL